MDPRALLYLTRQDPETQARIAENLRQQDQVCADLRAAGFNVQSLMELALSGDRRPYLEALPILMSWIPRVTSPDIREAIVRCFGYPWARGEPARFLLDLYRTTPIEHHLLRWAIGNALYVIADRSMVPEILEIVANRANGDSRQMMVCALGRFRNAGAEPVLIDLLTDDDAVLQACMALGRLRAHMAEAPLRKLLGHPRKAVQKKVAKVLKRIAG